MTMDRALIDWYRRFPEGWWGYHWSMPQPMSAVEIIGSGSLDARLMATLWALMARRRGVMLASEAPQAGKTTTLSALVDFLPDHTVGVFLRGWAQDMDWTDEIGPDRGFLLINEMSDHLPIYVWGPNARAALRLAGSGYGFGGTMHADSLDEALDCLRGELGAPGCRPGRPDRLPAVLRLSHAVRACTAGWRRPGTCGPMSPARWRRSGWRPSTADARRG